jgi:small subunit ribosomal protein S1
LQEDPWEADIPDRFQPGSIVKGKVTKITNFGVFVELETELEGLLHISELADHKVESPEDVVSVGEELEVRILRVDTIDRKIGLSRRLSVDEESEALETVAGGGDSPKASAPRGELLGGTGAGAGPLFSTAPVEEATAAEEVAAEEVAAEEVAAADEESEPAEEAASDDEAVAEVAAEEAAPEAEESAAPAEPETSAEPEAEAASDEEASSDEDEESDIKDAD